MGREGSGRNGVPGPGEPSLAEARAEEEGLGAEAASAAEEALAERQEAGGEPAAGEECPGEGAQPPPGNQGAAPDEATAAWQAEVEALREELARARQQFERVLVQRDQALEQLSRLKAEFDNYRRRTQAEAEAMRARASEALVGKLLPVVDNLERALAAASGAPQGGGEALGAVAGLVSGVQLVLNQFREILQQEGLRPIPSVGELFDPNRHEAVLQVEVDEGPDGVILEELQRGYLLGERVLRPSMVKVARRRPAGGS